MSARPVTQRTIERVANLRRLVDMLRQGELMRDDAAAPLQIEVRTARAYFDELAGQGLIEVARREMRCNNLLGKPIYRLAASDERIEAFLCAAERGEHTRQRCGPTRSLALAQATPGRRIHIMQDDAPFFGKLLDLQVKADPFALPAAFFRGRAMQGAMALKGGA
jgi:hypothetical protein